MFWREAPRWVRASREAWGTMVGYRGALEEACTDWPKICAITATPTLGSSEDRRMGQWIGARELKALLRKMFRVKHSKFANIREADYWPAITNPSRNKRLATQTLTDPFASVTKMCKIPMTATRPLILLITSHAWNREESVQITRDTHSEQFLSPCKQQTSQATRQSPFSFKMVRFLDEILFLCPYRYPRVACEENWCQLLWPLPCRETKGRHLEIRKNIIIIILFHIMILARRFCWKIQNKTLIADKTRLLACCTEFLGCF